jgi:hypothetical protein
MQFNGNDEGTGISRNVFHEVCDITPLKTVKKNEEMEQKLQI